MVVMVTCKNGGHKYKSKVLQTPDEETLRSEPIHKMNIGARKTTSYVCRTSAAV
jgi:hypothetical protein